MIDGNIKMTKEMIDPFEQIKCPIYFISGNHEDYTWKEEAYKIIDQTNIKRIGDSIINFKNKLNIIGIDYLKDTVRSIYKSLRETIVYMKKQYRFLTIDLPKTIYFISSQELEDRYPDKTPKEREQLIGKEKGSVFIYGIGDKLKSGIEHDLRSPDYDDWGLDGDLLVYDKTIDRVIELTSMGIRVDEESLVSQLEKAGCTEKLELPYHQAILKKELPYTIGGGIGISRIIMLILGKTHIAEAQASSWDDEILTKLKDKKVL